MKTKNILYIAFCFTIVFLFTSCTKVITLDLKDSEPLYVIEGSVNKGELIHFVNITQSIKFSTLNSFPTVSGAEVVLSDDNGNSEVLIETTPGKYATSNLLGVEGRKYTLSVKIEGKEFISSSTMPTQVQLDELYFLEGNFGGKEGGKVSIPIRHDPKGIANKYKFDMSVSRFEKNKGFEMDSMVIIQDDQFSDGEISQQPIFGSLGTFFTNDTVRISMMCIDQNVYEYFYSLSLNGPNGAATPANPVSNFSGGCLGYFTAQTKESIEVVVP